MFVLDNLLVYRRSSDVMTMKKVCINAANLRQGGGVQVATSFIYELSKLPHDDLDIAIFVSTEVSENLNQLGLISESSSNFKVIDLFGLSSLWHLKQREFFGFDLVFTVFGPVYFIFMPGKQLVGFAQPWIIYLKNEVYRSFNLLNKLKLRAKFFLQAMFFRRADKIIVELDHVRHGLVECKLARYGDIYVVHNCVSSVYFRPDLWHAIRLNTDKAHFSIGFVSRDYSHKNISMLLAVKKLFMLTSLKVDIYVTLTQDEWIVRSDEFKSLIQNAGKLSVAECPSFYQKMDAVIFPSLLECFSATPLEAMVMEKPLFASDRQFVRNVCGDFAWYFDPLDPESAFNQIRLYIENIFGRDSDRLTLARKHAQSFSSAEQRAEQYLQIIRSELE